MKLLVCIDDTDNLDSKGTGTIADEMREIIKAQGFGDSGFVTRHQLLLHSDIPYTSHNSSMCFDCEIEDGRYEELLEVLFAHLQTESAPGSDPGLAIAKIDGSLDEQEFEQEFERELLRFGLDAKRRVLTKEQAYDVAARHGVWLREAGGTGLGVVGALAGIGLRLGGNDGEVKGGAPDFLKGETYSVEQIMQTKGLHAVCDADLNPVPLEDKVYIPWKAKFILSRGKVILIVSSTAEPHLWNAMVKDDLRRFGDERVYREGCESFVADVEEEKVATGEMSCLNCRYRRWTEEGFLCSLHGSQSGEPGGSPRGGQGEGKGGGKGGGKGEGKGLSERMDMGKPQKFDAVVIGAGAIGGFVARHLMRTKLSLAILEKNSDVCCEVTRANTAIIHCGYNGKPGSLKAKLNVRANENFGKVCEELQVEFLRCGSLMVATGDRGLEKIAKKMEHGIQNGVKGLRVLSREEALEMEPNLNPAIISALYAPSTGIVNPWEFGLAAVENAVDNGARLFLNTKVTGIRKRKEGYRIQTDRGDFRAMYVINCAGLYADEINEMINEPSFMIKPRRGEYYILDTPAKDLVKHIIFNAHEDEDTKGIIVSPTVHGNIMIGPTAFEVDSKDDFGTNQDALDGIRHAVNESVMNVPFDLVIRSFSGIRPRPNWLLKDAQTGEYNSYEDDIKDFIIREQGDGFFNVAGIKSPGLACADEIGQYVAEMVLAKMDDPAPNTEFNPRRRERVRFASLTQEGRCECIEKDSKYGKIVCRCRQVTEAEVIDAIHRNVGARSVDGVKRRAGTSLGRCQGSFCTEEILRILSRELGMPMDRIEKDQGDAAVVAGIIGQY
jgi:glycerol-3-phosphate dehydrogenase